MLSPLQRPGWSACVDCMSAGAPLTIPTLRACSPEDIPEIFEIINDAAGAYKGVIPADRWHEPYMPMDELEREIEVGVRFWSYTENDTLLGVMGIQDVQDVTLIRHAYVRRHARNHGIGGKLLRHLLSLTRRPVLIGTWADAVWAISFYERYGFEVVGEAEKIRLLRKYWNVPERQIASSVVLADTRWRER